MELHELVIEMKLLERRASLYEEKYGVLSEDFYAALMYGEFRTMMRTMNRVPISVGGKGVYETLCRRKDSYRKQLEGRDLAEVFRVQPA